MDVSTGLHKLLDATIMLKEDGLKSLKSLAGKRFLELSEDLKERFEEVKLRILQYSVVNEPSLDEEKEDKIKKEIFRRYNSGIIPLKREEIHRAEFIDDQLTLAFNNLFKSNQKLYDYVERIFLPKSQTKAQKRDKLNILVTRIRRLVTLPVVPIRNYAHSSSKNEVISSYYNKRIVIRDTNSILDEFEKIMDVIISLKKILSKNANKFYDSGLLYECCYWIFSILYVNYCDTFKKIDLEEFSQDIENSNNIDFFWTNIDGVRDSEEIFETTGSHYYKSILNRYTFIANYFSTKYTVSLDNYLKNSNDFNKVMNDNFDALEEINHFRLNKTDPTSMTIEDIMQKINKSRFLIRPAYQRSEVTNPIKSAYLMESIMLGIKIPPIFIYKRTDKVSEVIDGQQRLLSIIGFLGESYLNEEGNTELSQKNMYKLKGLKILNELNDCDSKEIGQDFIDKILEFQLDVVEIDAVQNPHFNNIDLFLRLNTKPYPIKPNTFELWNAYVNKEIIMSIREISNTYSGQIFRAQDTRMRNEELITSLAYMDYKRDLTGNELRSVLNIYIRSGRVSARIKEKADITKILSDITNKDSSTFEESIQKVLLFIEKNKILTNNDNSLINVIFNHKSKSNSSRTDQNFYFLYILLDKLCVDVISNRKPEIISKLTSIYKVIQKAPENYTIEDLYDIIDNFSVN
ncbi:DUF262 domain-containing protein [Mycolicibacterium fortuitum]|nr:DUF262 domain-containing protein [Mycolicibacterium fortuitum]MDV7195775.1 DUF262 domain-containing protein [Mycolicibacterium fortuitum]